MSSINTSWKSAFTAFWDKRALIMLFLGFSAGIPILLIFSSLSLWLGEAGIDKSAVTFFSWAALGYSFKFVWAPLIDELPLPFLTRVLGRRRAWLLVAQLLIILSICIMALADPAMGSQQVIQMAIGAVLLGFSAATQDIVIDAYRIELAEAELQTVLAATYNAGYRIGMIVAGAGALFLAAYLGTAKGNYVYSAWQSTYFVMAAVMLVGIATTLIIHEPITNRIRKDYKRSDYYRLVMVFALAVSGFVLSYVYLGHVVEWIKQHTAITDNFLLFLVETLRFILAIAAALTLGFSLVKMGAVNAQMARETWLEPVLDFFRRYGKKLALVLLLLIGFYRVSDIIAGVISNVFYQDLNFSKEQIAEAVKVYGVLFSLLGGFVGGLLAQRFSIMKLLFVGAVLASATNLIFIGLVKSGQPFTPVQLTVAQQQFTAQPDEVGYWKMNIPKQVLLSAQTTPTGMNPSNSVVVQAGVAAASSSTTEPLQSVQQQMPYLIHDASAANDMHIQLLPIALDNMIHLNELKQNIVIQGQISGLDTTQLAQQQPIQLFLDGESVEAKLDATGVFNGSFPASTLQNAASKNIEAIVQLKDGRQLQASQTYMLSKQNAAAVSVLVDPISPIDRSAKAQETVEISGKVIKPYSTAWLYFAIVVDNLASGLAGAAFIAFLSSLTNVSFTAVQYAIFSSLMTLTPKILGGYSGTIVTHIGYPDFFLMTTLLGIPILLLVLWVGRLLHGHAQSS